MATAAVIGPAVLALTAYLPLPWLGLALAVPTLLGAMEWAVLARAPALPWLLALVLMLLYLGLQELPWVVPVVLGASIIWWLAALLLLRRGGARWPKRPLAQGVLGLCTLAPAWLGLMDLAARSDGRGAVLLCLLMVWMADTAAYGAGKAWGRHRLAPLISPGKTIEGAMAGVIAAALMVTLGGALLWSLALGHLVALAALGGITAAASVVGDLTESLLKRHAGVKDSGALLPGHGGVLDRIDALAAAVPVFALGLGLVLGR